MSGKAEKVEKLETGVVSFLDVLGWKGIWVNHENAINLLTEFMSIFRTESEAMYRKITADAVNLEIILFSDTIVIFTPDLDFSESILFHSKACKWAIENGLENKLPLRGAIGYGEYSYYSKTSVTMIGPVIDEVSVWGEKVNWIGVILAPSVVFESRFKDIDIKNFESIRVYSSIPFKENINGLDLCVKWGDSKGIYLLENLLRNQKYTSPEITLKYLNTLLFLESYDKVEAKDSNLITLLEAASQFGKKQPNQKETKDSVIKDSYVLKEGATLEFGEFDLLSVHVLQIFPDSLKVSWITPTSKKDYTVYMNKIRNNFGYTSSAGNHNHKDEILKIGDCRTFKGFNICVSKIFDGLNGKLVEFEVEWFRKSL